MEVTMDKPIRLSRAVRDLLRRRAHRERVEITPARLETLSAPDLRANRPEALAPDLGHPKNMTL
jgi:hypothetical protein